MRGSLPRELERKFDLTRRAQIAAHGSGFQFVYNLLAEDVGFGKSEDLAAGGTEVAETGQIAAADVRGFNSTILLEDVAAGDRV